MSNRQSAGDTAGHFPDLESARAYATGGHANTPPSYHEDRMRALRRLVRTLELGDNVRVVDFGCGDGMYFKDFFATDAREKVSKILGVDISSAMIQLAGETLQDFPFEGRAGGVEVLSEVDEQFDIGFAIDVLGYLSESDLDVFYSEMSRIIKPGGHLIVMYGNELFDMFALNSGTAAFFQKHFEIDVADLLTEGRAEQYKTADRKNPLSFGSEISRYGFQEIEQAFSQWHRIPPAIGNKAADLAAARLDMRDHSLDPNELEPRDAWKAMFRCSIFASLSRRSG